MSEYTLEGVRRTIQQVKSVEGTMKGAGYRKFLKSLYKIENELEGGGDE